MRNLTTVLVALALAACATTGTKVDEATAAKFLPDVTTEADVVKALGPAQNTLRNADGTRTTMYVYAHAQIKGASFIPIVGLFAGGAKTEGTTAVFHFAANGKLLDMSNGTQASDVTTH